MNLPPDHPLLDEARRLTDAAADRIHAIAVDLTHGHASLAQLVAASLTFAARNAELTQLEQMVTTTTVQGRVYVLRRNVRGGN